jgi:hypothetical protein
VCNEGVQRGMSILYFETVDCYNIFGCAFFLVFILSHVLRYYSPESLRSDASKECLRLEGKAEV